MNNVERIRQKFDEYKIDAMFITSDINRRFASNFYATDGYMLITRKNAVFFTDSRYTEAAGKEVVGASVFPVTSDGKHFQYMNDMLSDENAQFVGIEERRVSLAEHKYFSEKLNGKYVMAEKLINDLRAVKTEAEIDAIIAAQRIAEKSLLEILPLINCNITERELAAELLYRMLRNGAEDCAFDTIAVSGERSSMPHGVPTDEKIKKGFLTIDFGAKKFGYCSDMTRTYCIGEPTAEMKLVYNTVLEAQMAGLEAASANVTGAQVDKAARDVIEKAGFGQYFGHAFGHSLGLEIHENPNASPRENTLLPVGAVISAEPGIYIPGKFGVRIEDLMLIKQDKCENLTKMSKELTVL